MNKSKMKAKIFYDNEGAPEWVERVVSQTLPSSDDFYFDWREAEFRVKFIESHCRYPEGPKAGQLITLDDWQKERIIFPTFGWKERASDLRRFRMVFEAIPRKNAKTTLTAAIALSILFQDGEEAAQIYTAAGEKGQATIIYDAMKYMVGADPLMNKRCKLFRNEARYPEKRSYVKVLSADARTKHGFNAHAVLFDELHTQPNRDLWDVLTSSMLSREQPITMVMTTAGTNTNSLCYEIWEYARSIRDGLIVDDRFLAVLFEALPDDDWNDPKVWKKANPALGSFLTEKNFEIEYQKAVKMPSYINTFKNLHLNVWTNSAEGWIDDETWMRCADDLDDDYLQTLPCWAGLDLASVRDLCAFGVVYVDEKKQRFYLKVHHFVNSEKARNKKLSAGVDYLRFQDEGSVTITEGNATDHSYILDWIRDFASKNDLRQIAFDRHLSGYIAAQLHESKIEVVPFGQGYVSMSFPTKQFETLVMNGQLRHDGNNCLRWQLGCVIIERSPADDIKVTKNKNRESQKVDGVVAAIMALGQYYDYKGSQPKGAKTFKVVGFNF